MVLLLLMISAVLLTQHVSVLGYQTDFPKFLVDFLKMQENPVHINIHMDPLKRMFARKIERELSANHIKSNINTNIEIFLLLARDAAVTVNVLSLEGGNGMEILRNAETLGYFRAPHKWIIFGKISTLQQYNLYFRVDSKIFVCEKIMSGYNVSAIYKVNEKIEQYQLNSIGLWAEKEGFVYNSPLSIYNQRRNLRKTTFTLSYLFNSPITYKTIFEYRMTHIDSSPRFTYLITQILIAIFNVEPKYIIQNSYGNPIANSTEYTGIIGDVKSGRAVMGATPVFFVASRVSILEYIAPNTRSYLNFYFKSPPLSYVSNIFVKPFDKNVWYSCFLLTGLTLASMYAILRWEWKEPHFRNQIQNMLNATKPTISNVAILQVGVISQQGSDTELKSSSGRIAMVFSLIAFMFLYTAYSANIVAILQSTSNSIRDLKDLVNSGIDFGVEKVPYFVPFFKHAHNSIGKEIYQKKLKPKGDKFMMPLSEGTEKMRSQFFAFYTEASSINKLMSDYFDEAEKCSVRSVEYVKIREPWLIAQKHGSYTELLKIGMLRLRELGFYMAERKRIFYENPTCHSKLSRFFSAGLIDTYPGFLFFGVGCCLGFLVFFMEILLKKMKRKKFEAEKISSGFFKSEK